jgi:curved DNA-binding protein CbpA
MKDYYKILGVNKEASDEEIRARWIELMKHYHPDLSKGEKDDERIKEINEAYQVLKNESTRMDYDLETDLKRSFIKRKAKKPMGKGFYIGIISVGAVIVLLFILRPFVSKQSPVVIQPKETVKDSASEKPEARTGEVYPQGPTPAQEAVSRPPREVLSKPVSKPGLPGKTDSSLKVKRQKAPLKLAKVSPLVSEPKDPVPQVLVPVPNTDAPRSSLPEPTPTVEIPKPEMVKPEAREKIAVESSEMAKAKAKEAVTTQVRKSPKPPVIAKPGETVTAKLKEPEKVAEARAPVPESLPVPKSEPLAKAEPALPAPPRKEEARPVLPQDRPVKAEVAIAPPPRPLPPEEEVRRFFAGYVDRYVGNDIEGFLSLFSPGAIQNKKDGMEGIRKIYTHFFNQSQELSYRLEEPKVEIYQNGLAVKARYEVSQILKKGGARKIWKGQGRWFLAKEEGKLKIVSLDYQHD